MVDGFHPSVTIVLFRRLESEQHTLLTTVLVYKIKIKKGKK